MTVRASKNLLRYLHYIGDALQKAKATTAKDRGHSIVHVSLNARTVKLKHIHELGKLIERVASGEDAGKVFRQDERTKPKKTDLHKLMALAYWSARALNPKDKKSAYRWAREVSGEVIEDSTLEKHIARPYRDKSIEALARMSLRQMGGLSISRNSKTYVIKSPSAEQVANLAEYLRKKSPRKNADK